MAKSVRIILEEDGYPRELLSQEDWTRALASGSLQRETEVTVYRDDAPPQYMRACEVAELEPLFRPAAPSRDSPPALPAPVAEPAEPMEARPRPSPWAREEPAEASWYDDDAYCEEEADDPDAAERDTPEPPARPARSPLLIFLAGLAALFVILWIANAGSGPGAAATAAASYRVTGTANVRTLPSTTGSEIVGRLRTGDVVTGVPRSSGGESWIQISTGPNAGRFVWARNLAPAP